MKKKLLALFIGLSLGTAQPAHAHINCYTAVVVYTQVVGTYVGLNLFFSGIYGMITGAHGMDKNRNKGKPGKEFWHRVGFTSGIFTTVTGLAILSFCAAAAVEH